MTISLQSEQYWKPHQGISFESLRPIAQRQIKSLLRRMKFIVIQGRDRKNRFLRTKSNRNNKSRCKG